MAANGQDPLEIFPLPVWECVLDQLRKEEGSSRDVLNCTKVCTEFERILEPKKQEWLFESICPFIFPYLKGGELLACRKVCKNWRRGVDNFLEDFETWHPFKEGTSDISRSTLYDPLHFKGIKWRRMWNEGKLVMFLERMKKQEMKTPFVGRSLSLVDLTGRRGRGTEFFFERALEMFSLYGDHIWHLSVMQPMIPCQFYHLVKQMLSCTPNLKSLIFEVCASNQFEDDISELNLLEDHPLPEINSLETLEIRTNSLLPVVILGKLKKKINLENLKCLKLHNYNSNYNFEPYAGVGRLQHLSELHVSGIKWADLERILLSLIQTAPLAKLSVGLDGLINIKEINLIKTCSLVSMWSGTLRMLAIKGNKNSDFRERGKSLKIIDAPNLKSLELEGILFELYFLAPAVIRSLEYLHIRYNGTRRPPFGPGMEFYKCVFEEGGLHNSSIWGQMEKLKVIRIQRPHLHSHRNGRENVICTREMHERGIQAKIVVPDFVYYNSDGDD